MYLYTSTKIRTLHEIVMPYAAKNKHGIEFENVMRCVSRLVAFVLTRYTYTKVLGSPKMFKYIVQVNI